MTPSVPALVPRGAVLPALPPEVPTRKYTLAKPIGRFLLWSLGWEFTGGFANEPRQILIGWPHTSNWDGIIGLAAGSICGIDVHVFAKKALFNGPIGWIMRELGGIPGRARTGGRDGRRGS